MNDPILTEAEAAARLYAKPCTLNKWRTRRKGPAYLRLGGKVRYRLSDIEAFIEASRVEPGRKNGRRKREKRSAA